MKSVSLVILASVLSFVSACAPKVNDPADVQAIRQLADDYVKAVNARDATAVVAAMTDKTGFSDPHMPAFVGKDAIAGFHQALFDQFESELRAPVGDVRVVGNLGVARGSWTQKLTPRAEGEATVNDSGSWILAVQRQDDGAWKWDWYVANNDQPMPGTTADGAEEKALMQIERDWVRAVAKSDVATLEPILATEWTVNADGQVTTRAQTLAALKTGVYKVESATLRDLRAHVFGDAAIATSTVVMEGTYKGADVSASFRSTDFFVRRDGRWQAVSTQNVTIKP